MAGACTPVNISRFEKAWQLRLRVFRLASAILLGGLVPGCIGPERVCNEGETPVLLLSDGQLTGGDCLESGEELKPGFVRYPPDIEPTYLRDWDIAKRTFQGRIDRGEWQP